MDEIWQFLTVLIALVVALISYRQYAVARDRFRLDLFEKRYGVFCGARDFVASVVREGRVVDTAQREFWRATSDVQFLFGSDVVEYLDLLNRQAAQAHYHRMSTSSVTLDEGHRQHVDAETLIILWFAKQIESGLTHVFLPYLGFGRWSGKRFWRRKLSG